MDWSVIAQAIFFLSLAFLAVVITVFVFASSLLGRAVDAATKDQDKLKTDYEKQQNERLKQAKEELSRLEKCGAEQFKVEQAKASILEIEKQAIEFNRQSLSITRDYSVFNISGGVVYPTICFLVASISSIVAWSLAQQYPEPRVVYLWSFGITLPLLVSVVALAFGIHRLYFSLRKIQDVAKTSEQSMMDRMLDTMLKFMTEMEIKTKPELELLFHEPKPPIKAHIDSSVAINPYVRLIEGKGDVAKSITVYLFLPTGFKFVEGELWNDLGPWYANPNYTILKMYCTQLLAGEIFDMPLKLTSPHEPGNTPLFYQLLCEGFKSNYRTFGVQVIS